jgi:hypothetical protein
MAYMCSLCGGIVELKQGANFPICSLSGDICIGNEVETQDCFVDAIRVLQAKGYRLMGYKIPRLDGWESDYIMTIVFNPHTVPDIYPPEFQIMELVEVGGVMLYYHYDPADFGNRVTQSAVEVKEWADTLPAVETVETD